MTFRVDCMCQAANHKEHHSFYDSSEIQENRVDFVWHHPCMFAINIADMNRCHTASDSSRAIWAISSSMFTVAYFVGSLCFAQSLAMLYSARLRDEMDVCESEGWCCCSFLYAAGEDRALYRDTMTSTPVRVMMYPAFLPAWTKVTSMW